MNGDRIHTGPIGPQLLAAASLSLLIALANVLLQFPINRFLTWGTPVIALTFGVNELTHLKLGTRTTARIVTLGFFGGLLLTSFVAPGQIALASAVAFLSAHLLDVCLFRALRQRAWWLAPLLASVAATLLDTLIFFGLAFWRDCRDLGPLILGDLATKFAVDIFFLVPFRAAMRRGPRFGSRARPRAHTAATL